MATGGGALALLGHSVRWQGDSLRDELEGVYARLPPDLLVRDPGFPGLRREADDGALPDEIISTGRFDDVTSRAVPWSERFTAAGLVDHLVTQSDHRLLTDLARAELLDAIREVISGRGEEVVVPQVTTLTLARVRAG